MRVKKIIHEELGKDLEDIGFAYIQGMHYMWQYKREKEGVLQEIVIISKRYERRNLKVLFRTSAYGQREYKEFADFVSEESVKKKEYWGYENEGGLREIIKEFRRLIFTYGLDFLEEISKPSTDAIPTEELHKYLYENHQALFEEYAEKFQTKDKEPEEVIGIIYEKMKEALDQSYEEVKEYLCGLAALYGHTICWGNRGKWVWDVQEKECYIDKVLETKKSKDVLGLVVIIWDYLRKHRNVEHRSLYEHYETILAYYYRDHPEEIKDAL